MFNIQKLDFEHLELGTKLTVQHFLLFLDTDNELTNEIGGYEHVVVLSNLKVVDGDLIKVLEELPRGTIDGDCILH